MTRETTEEMQRGLDCCVAMLAPNALMLHRSVYDMLSGLGLDMSGCEVILDVPSCGGSVWEANT